MANIITGCRILCSILLLFVPALFFLPLTISVVDLKYCGGFICALATVAAVHEGYIIKNDNNTI